MRCIEVTLTLVIEGRQKALCALPSVLAFPLWQESHAAAPFPGVM